MRSGTNEQNPINPRRSIKTGRKSEQPQIRSSAEAVTPLEEKRGRRPKGDLKEVCWVAAKRHCVFHDIGDPRPYKSFLFFLKKKLIFQPSNTCPFVLPEFRLSKTSMLARNWRNPVRIPLKIPSLARELGVGKKSGYVHKFRSKSR